MESKESHLGGACQAEWFLPKARLALALAVIKNRPSGMSGREHAEALARRFKSQDESWKEKAQGLQQELLKLRQELLITSVKSNTKSGTEAAGPEDTVDNASLDLFSPSSEAYSADSETPDLLQQDPQPAPPSHQPPAPSSQRTALPHVHFLQALCTLDRVEGNHRGLEALWFSPGGGAGSLLVKSVCQLLDSLVAACRAPPQMGPVDLVQQACQVAARAMDTFCSQRLPTAEFTRHVERSLTELTALLLHGHRPRRAAERLMECLITLGSSSMSKSFLIRHILSEISALADRLWQAFQEDSGLLLFPVDQYQNSCYLFWILEELLQGSQVSCWAAQGAELGEEHGGVLRHLERRLLPMLDEFPLFFIYMWRIGTLLGASD